MSEQTKAALDEALQAHLNEHAGTPSLVIGYAMVVAYKTDQDFDDQTTRYMCEYMEHQPFHAAMGLVLWHGNQLAAEQAE